MMTTAERLKSAGTLGGQTLPERDFGAGDESVETIYRVYFPFLRKIASRKFLVPVGDVDDLVHDVFASYLANPANVRDRHRYLIGATCNASRQYWKRRVNSPVQERPQEFDTVVASDDLVDGVIRNLVIGATLSRLGAKCRDTLERFYLHGETTAAIATSRDTSPGYICRLLNYCRNRARSVVKQMDGGC